MVSEHQCAFVHVYERESERERERVFAAGCFVVAQRPGGQQMSSCSAGLERLSSEHPFQLTNLPTKQPACSLPT